MVENGMPATASALPYADRVRLVATEEPFRWLAAGWRDFRRGGIVSLAYGLIFVIAGFALSAGLFLLNVPYLLLPLVAGFLLVGPALTVGFYAVSRDIEQDRRPSLARALLAWRANRGPLLGLGLVLLAFLVVWMRLAALVFALSFPYAGFDVQRMLNATLFTADGLVFLALGSAVGAVLAAIAFAAGAFSLPLLLDRQTGIVEALVTSVVAVVLNARTMMVWAGLIVLFTAAGLATAYIGLAVTLPLAGHATWHAYRAVIRPANAGARPRA